MERILEIIGGFRPAGRERLRIETPVPVCYAAVDPDRLRVELSAGAAAHLVVLHTREGISALDVTLAEGAQLEYTELFLEGAFGETSVTQAARSRCRLTTALLSGANASYRLDLTGPDAENDLGGVFLLGGSEHGVVKLLTRHLSADCRIAVADPVYPVYVDSNVMAGRAGTLGPDGRWSRIVYLPCTAEGGFKPDLPDERVDVVYLCSPNNPTGVALTRDELKRWVDYALANEVLLLFDAAYEAFVRHDDVPHSVYEIDGARDCAVEFRSFSKTAGFTGVRCGYTVVPRCLKVRGADGRHVALTPLWNRRQCTKFNGASYITQRGAEAIYTPEGQRQVREHIDYYLANARLLREGAARAGLEAYGGEDSPYVWLRTPEGCGSWAFFDRLLADAGLVTTPGVGFGPCGEGYVRLTAFNTHEATAEAVERLADLHL